MLLESKKVGRLSCEGSMSIVDSHYYNSVRIRKYQYIQIIDISCVNLDYLVSAELLQRLAYQAVYNYIRICNNERLLCV